MDGVMDDIAAVNDGVYAGTIQVDQARVLHAGYKQVMKAIAEEISLAKYMGKVDLVAKRWFKRIDESTMTASAGLDSVPERLARLEQLIADKPRRVTKRAEA